MPEKPRARTRIAREAVVDVFAVAADAVAAGIAVEGDWETLAAWSEAHGVAAVARELAARGEPGGPSEEWWRCNILLSTELSVQDTMRVCCELLELEGNDQEPVLDVDRHALEVSRAVRYLEQHLQRLRAGVATRRETQAASMVVQAARVARRRG